MIKQIEISKIKPNKNNPRIIKDFKFKKLVQSIKNFPEMLKLRPIVVDENNTILGGNMRYRAGIKAGLKKIWIIEAADLSKQKKQEFIIKDNVSFGEWDWEVLANQWDVNMLKDWGMDLPSHKFLDDVYSEKIGKVTYEPKATSHKPSELFDECIKFDDEIKEIKNKDIRKLLKIRQCFFSQFNFSKIADYYAYQADEDEKRIFEKMALILLDKDQLIENGFFDLVDNLTNTDYGQED